MSSYQNIQINAMDDFTAVRTRPGMYVGDPREGPHQMGLEILYWLNALIGRFPQREARLRLSSDGAYSFEVLGQGSPEGIDETEQFFSNVHACSPSSACLVAAVNMLSRWFTWTNWSQGVQYHLRFEDGLLVQRKEEPSAHPDGFCVSFLPDLLIFPTPTLGSDRILIERFCDLASVPGLDVTIESDEHAVRVPALHHKETIQKFCTEEAIFPEMLSVSGTKEEISVEATLHWTRSPDEAVLSFCNGSQTHTGGTHIVGVRVGVKRAIQEYATERSISLPEKTEYRRGLACVVSVTMERPMFGGQMRDKLVSADARRVVEALVYEGALRFLQEHPDAALVLLEQQSATKSTSSIPLKISVPELPARVLSAAYHNERSEAIQRMLLIAEDPNSSQERLMMVASCLAPEVRRALAQNPSAPLRALLWVARDFPDEVLQNPIVPLLWLSEPDWPLRGWGVLAALASSAFAPEVLLVLAAESREPDAKVAVWNNPRTPKELKRRISKEWKQHLSKEKYLYAHLRKKRG